MLRFAALQSATSRCLSQQAKAPIKLYSTEGRYATALYTVSSSQQKLQEAEKDMSAVKTLFESNRDFK